MRQITKPIVCIKNERIQDKYLQDLVRTTSQGRELRTEDVGQMAPAIDVELKQCYPGQKITCHEPKYTALAVCPCVTTIPTHRVENLWQNLPISNSFTEHTHFPVTWETSIEKSLLPNCTGLSCHLRSPFLMSPESVTTACVKHWLLPFDLKGGERGRGNEACF